MTAEGRRQRSRIRWSALKSTVAKGGQRAANPSEDAAALFELIEQCPKGQRNLGGAPSALHPLHMYCQDCVGLDLEAVRFQVGITSRPV